MSILSTNAISEVDVDPIIAVLCEGLPWRLSDKDIVVLKQVPLIVNSPPEQTVVLNLSISPLSISIPIQNPAKAILSDVPIKKSELKMLLAKMVSGVWLTTFGGILDPCQREKYAICVPLLEKGMLDFDGRQRQPFSLKWPKNDMGSYVVVSCQPWYFSRNKDDERWVPKLGATVGTCYREVQNPHQQQLFNTYTQAHSSLRHADKYQYIIRHAVVDTNERAMMLASLLRHLEITEPRRVRMLCLLTRRQDKDEEELWKRQCTMSNLIACELEGTELAHLSLQANANQNFNFWNHGEDSNSLHNSTAWLKYVMWLLIDSKELFDPTSSCASEITRIMEIVESVLPQAMAGNEEKFGKLWFTRQGFYSTSNPVYSTMRTLVTQGLPSVEGWLKEIAQNRDNRDRSRASMLYFACLLLQTLLKSQYPPVWESKTATDSTISRVNEFLTLAMLDRCLGVTACLNCKSGCDRAGLVHALTTAVYTLMDTYPDLDDLELLVSVCGEFDKMADQVDSSIESPEVYLQLLHQWSNSTSKHRVKRGFLRVCELRQIVLMTLMQISWKVNIYSSGMPGLKFHLGSVQANPHVPITLPPYVFAQYPDQTPKLVEIRRKLKMEPQFATFLNGGSEFRGA